MATGSAPSVNRPAWRGSCAEPLEGALRSTVFAEPKENPGKCMKKVLRQKTTNKRDQNMTVLLSCKSPAHKRFGEETLWRHSHLRFGHLAIDGPEGIINGLL